MSKEKHRRQNLEYYHKRRAELIELLGGTCSVCGSTEHLEFDHIDSTTKAFTLCSSLTASKDKILAELSKCQLLCRSCHIKKTKAQGDGNTRLSVSIILAIRETYATTDINQTDLAATYGIGQTTVSAILRGYRWPEVAALDNLQEIIDTKRYKAQAANRFSASTMGNKRKPILQLDPATGAIIKRYPYLSAVNEDGFRYQNVAQCCKGITAQYKGFVWRFA